MNWCDGKLNYSPGSIIIIIIIIIIILLSFKFFTPAKADSFSEYFEWYQVP